MSRATASERVERILSVLPWIVESPGTTVDEVCERFGLDAGDLIADLDLLMYDVGIHPFTPDARVDVLVEDDRIYVHLGDYFRRPLRLTPDEAIALYAAGRAVLDRPEPDPTLQRAVAKLGGALGEDAEAQLEVNLGEADPEVLATVERAVRERRRVRIDHYSFARDERSVRDVDPERLVADGGHWYLLGWCLQAEAPRSFRVDRISSAELTDTPVAEHPGGPAPDPDLSDADATVVLELPRSAAWVLDTFPTISSEEQRDGRIRAVLRVSATPWLERLLLRLGPDVRAQDGDGVDLAPLAAAAADRVLRRYS